MLPSDRQDTFLAARTDRQTPAGLASYGLHPMCRIAACGRPDPSQPCMHALSRACSLTRCTSHKLYVPTCTFWLSSLLCTAARNLCPEFKDDERDRKLAILVVATQGRLAIQQDQVNAMYRRPCGAHPKDSQTQQVSTSHSVCSSCIHAHDTIPLLRKKREKYNSNI